MRMHLVQIFHDGERLKQHRPVAVDERGNDHLRIDRLERECALVALDEIDGHDLGLEAFEIERDAYPVGRERAPEREQLHLIILPICRENRRRL